MPRTPQNRSIKEAFALEHNILVLLGALLVIGMGEELWTRFMPKYLEALGAGAISIGAYGSFKRVVDTLYQYPGGWISDRIGRKRALTLFSLIAALGYLLYLLTSRWELVLAGTLLVLAWSSMSQPAIFALIGDTLKKSRRAWGSAYSPSGSASRACSRRRWEGISSHASDWSEGCTWASPSRWALQWWQFICNLTSITTLRPIRQTPPSPT